MVLATASDRSWKPIVNPSESIMCRSLPHTNHFLVTAYEKADAQILCVRDREVPKAANSGHCEQSEAISCIRH